MKKDEEEMDFMSRVIPEVYEMFDKEDVFMSDGEKSNKEVLRIFLNATKLIETRYRELRTGYSDDFYMDTSRVFYDALYGHLVGSTYVVHYSKGGWILSCLSAFSIIGELSNSLAMYLDDDEIPHIDPNNKYVNRILRKKILKKDVKISKITGLINDSI